MNANSYTDKNTWGIKIFKDGSQWCVLWGPDLQVGVAGFGATLRLAIYDFDIAFAERQKVVCGA